MNHIKSERFSVSLNCGLQENFRKSELIKRFGKKKPPPLVSKELELLFYDVLNWLSNGMSREDIKSDFEELTDEMIDACLAYAADKERRVDYYYMNLLFDQNISPRILKILPHNFQIASK